MESMREPIDEEAFSSLSVKEMKELLSRFGVSYSDCFEKTDLKTRLVVTMHNSPPVSRPNRPSPFPPVTDPSRANYKSDAARAAAKAANSSSSSSSSNSKSNSQSSNQNNNNNTNSEKSNSNNSSTTNPPRSNPSNTTNTSPSSTPKRTDPPKPTMNPNSTTTTTTATTTKKEKTSKDTNNPFKSDNVQIISGISCLVIENSPDPEFIGIGFHSYSGNSKDLHSISSDILSSCQNRQKVRIYLPTAPIPLENLPHAYCWWPILFPNVLTSLITSPQLSKTSKLSPPGLGLTSSKILTFIEGISQKISKDKDKNSNLKFFLYGINQGAVLAVDVGLRMKEKVIMIGIIGGGIVLEKEWEALMKNKKEILEKAANGRVVANQRLKVVQGNSSNSHGGTKTGEDLGWLLRKMWEGEKEWVDLEWVEVTGENGEAVKSAMCKNLNAWRR